MVLGGVLGNKDGNTMKIFLPPINLLTHPSRLWQSNERSYCFVKAKRRKKPRGEVLPNWRRLSENSHRETALCGSMCVMGGRWWCIILKQHARARVLDCVMPVTAQVSGMSFSVVWVKCLTELILACCSEWTRHPQTLEKYWTSFEEGNADCLSPGNIQVIWRA